MIIGLDRDGTINKDIGYVTKPEEFEPIPGSLEAIKMIRDKGHDVIILTNQSGIAKGKMTPVDVDMIHDYMMYLMGQAGIASINALYYATSDLKDDIYAKPNTGMFKRAQSEIGVDFKKGFYVGDKISDLKAADAIKAAPVLVKTGYGLETLKKLETFANRDLKFKTKIFDNLLEFAESLESAV